MTEARKKLTIPDGAGSAGTGQLLNGYDLNGGFDSFKPKFANGDSP